MLLCDIIRIACWGQYIVWNNAKLLQGIQKLLFIILQNFQLMIIFLYVWRFLISFEFLLTFYLKDCLYQYDLFCYHFYQYQARIQNFFKGEVEEENFERKIFVDTRINACTHKNWTNMQLFLSSPFSRGMSSIFCFVLLLSFIFEIWKGGCIPRYPPFRSANEYYYIIIQSITIDTCKRWRKTVLPHHFWVWFGFLEDHHIFFYFWGYMGDRNHPPSNYNFVNYFLLNFIVLFFVFYWSALIKAGKLCDMSSACQIGLWLCHAFANSNNRTPSKVFNQFNVQYFSKQDK